MHQKRKGLKKIGSTLMAMAICMTPMTAFAVEGNNVAADGTYKTDVSKIEIFKKYPKGEQTETEDTYKTYTSITVKDGKITDLEVSCTDPTSTNKIENSLADYILPVLNGRYPEESVLAGDVFEKEDEKKSVLNGGSRQYLKYYYIGKPATMATANGLGTAGVDVVSGATFTVEKVREDVRSLLAKAPAKAASPGATKPAVTPAKTQQPASTPAKVTTPKVVKAKQPMTVKAKTKNVKYKKLKKKKQTVSGAIVVKKAEGKIAYKKAGGSKKLSVNKKGKIVVKKGTKKGKYSIKVKVTAAGNAKYLAGSKQVTVKIKVK